MPMRLDQPQATKAEATSDLLAGDRAGDGVLVEFPTAVDALSTAAIQLATGSRKALKLGDRLHTQTGSNGTAWNISNIDYTLDSPRRLGKTR